MLAEESSWRVSRNWPVNIYLFMDNNGNSRKRCEICSKLTIKTPERRRHRSGVFSVNLEHTSKLFVVFLMLTLNRKMLAGYKNIHDGCFKYHKPNVNIKTSNFYNFLKIYHRLTLQVTLHLHSAIETTISLNQRSS